MPRSDFIYPVLKETPRDISYFKPKGFEGYVTMRELCALVRRDPSWIRRLERAKRIPAAKRVTHGALEVRLWSPKQVEEIQLILSKMRPGRKVK